MYKNQVYEACEADVKERTRVETNDSSRATDLTAGSPQNVVLNMCSSRLLQSLLVVPQPCCSCILVFARPTSYLLARSRRRAEEALTLGQVGNNKHKMSLCLRGRPAEQRKEGHKTRPNEG
jgi:hypothetical protein